MKLPNEYTIEVYQDAKITIGQDLLEPSMLIDNNVCNVTKGFIQKVLKSLTVREDFITDDNAYEVVQGIAFCKVSFILTVDEKARCKYFSAIHSSEVEAISQTIQALEKYAQKKARNGFVLRVKSGKVEFYRGDDDTICVGHYNYLDPTKNEYHYLKRYENNVVFPYASSQEFREEVSSLSPDLFNHDLALIEPTEAQFQYLDAFMESLFGEEGYDISTKGNLLEYLVSYFEESDVSKISRSKAKRAKLTSLKTYLKAMFQI